MAKPFALSELEARTRALTRRAAGSAQTVLRHGPLTLDQVGHVATINDQVIDLSARELGLLEILLQRPGRLVSKEQLVDRLCSWGEEVSNNAIEVYVHRLRKKIEVGCLSYDQSERIARLNGEIVELSARELGLLEILLLRAGRLVGKDQMVDQLCSWGEEVSNNAIEVYIHRLRKKLEPGGARITTVRGLGYCLEKIAP